MAKGMEIEGVRICCQENAKVRVALRRDGTPHRATVSVLPETEKDGSLRCGHCGDEQSAGRRESALRLRRGTRGQKRVPHGFRLLPLPSDFLCQSCEVEFHDKVSVSELTDCEVAGMVRPDAVCLSSR